MNCWGELLAKNCWRWIFLDSSWSPSSREAWGSPGYGAVFLRMCSLSTRFSISPLVSLYLKSKASKTIANNERWLTGWSIKHISISVTDGSNIGGDESSFWSNSPSRSNSPSPNSIPNTIGSYQIYTHVGCTTPNRYAPYRTSKLEISWVGRGYSDVLLAYPTIHADTEMTTHITSGPFVRGVKRRSTANKKERRRTQSINNAYSDLRDCIPNVPADTKLSKVREKTLTKGIKYNVTKLNHTYNPIVQPT